MELRSSNAATAVVRDAPNPVATLPPNLVTIDVNRIFLHLCTFYLSHVANSTNTQATGDGNPGFGNALSDIAANNGLAVHSTIDEEERGVGPAGTAGA